MDESLLKKLESILARTNSPFEAEAQTAAEMLQKLLTKHNLNIADLERRGQAKATVEKRGHDLGKAAFNWKLDLAQVIASHYYCHPLVNRTSKTVAFVGRPDNVESLDMLYTWLINQIRQVASEERKKLTYHIDPLRWQVNFGIGIVQKLESRLRDIKRQQITDSTTTALVVHHDAEINDWLEENEGWRPDGKPTKKQQQRDLEWKNRNAVQYYLLQFNAEAMYKEFPSMRPKTEQEIEDERVRWEAVQAAWAKEDARSERSRRAAETRRANRKPTTEELRAEDQKWEARHAGREAGDRINLTPFLKEGIKVEALD